MSCLLQSVLKTLDSKRILCSYIYNSVFCSDSVSTDKHTLNKIVRVGFDNGSVHKCTGVALVSVAYKVFFLALALTCGIPLEPCREACTASSCKSGSLDDFDYFFGGHTAYSLFKSRVAVLFYIFLNYFRIDYTAVSESDTCLFCKELAVLVRNNKLFNFGNIASLYILGNSGSIVLAYLYQTDKLIFVVNIDNRFKIAHTDTACYRDILRVDVCIQKGFANLFSTCRNTAGALTYDNSHNAASLNSFKIFLVLSGVRAPYVSSLIIITGESEQQPKHATHFSEKSPSSVV